MMPRARARRSRRLHWPFGRRGNRRTRAHEPVVPKAPPPPLSIRLRDAIVRWRRALLALTALAALACGAYGVRYYVTHARHFAVAQVRITPLVHVNAESLLGRAAVPLGSNLFAVDREAVARSVSQEPWVAKVHVRRELPATLAIDVVERVPACVVAMGALYLADSDGTVFKRATPDEAATLPVITGVPRDEYLQQPERAQELMTAGMRAISAWQAKAGRPPLGEVHVDHIAGVTLYTADGVGVRVGAADESLLERLGRYDAVAGALGKTGEAPRLIYVDNRARPDRVTVKLASSAAPAVAAHSGTKD